MKIKLLNELAKVPTRGSEYAAGYDLYSSNTIPLIIPPHTTVKVPTGIATEIPKHLFAAVFPRSGLATKQGLRLANCVAVIDSDYRGEWFIPIYNDSDENRTISTGDRIAQAVFIPYTSIDYFEVVDELNDTERGDGGFGHTGVK